MFPRILVLATLVSFGISGCATTEGEGFVLTSVRESPPCQILTYQGKPVLIKNAKNKTTSTWGLGKCPGHVPGDSDLLIWSQESITISSPLVARMKSKPNKAGEVYLFTARPNTRARQTGVVSYVGGKK